MGLGENRVLSPNKFGNHWVEQSHMDTSFYCQTSHGDNYASGCLGCLGGARLCGISQTYLNMEPFPGKAAVRFVFCRACLLTFRKLTARRIVPFQALCLLAPPPSSLPTCWPSAGGEGWWVPLAPGPSHLSDRQPAAWCFMHLSCVRSCPLGRGCQRAKTQISRHTFCSGIMNHPSDH